MNEKDKALVKEILSAPELPWLIGRLEVWAHLSGKDFYTIEDMGDDTCRVVEVAQDGSLEPVTMPLGFSDMHTFISGMILSGELS